MHARVGEAVAIETSAWFVGLAPTGMQAPPHVPVKTPSIVKVTEVPQPKEPTQDVTPAPHGARPVIEPVIVRRR